MVAATTALDTMIRDVQRDGRVELAAITAAHEALMRGDPLDAGYAGLRDMQTGLVGATIRPAERSTSRRLPTRSRAFSTT